MKFDTLQDHEFRRDEWNARERLSMRDSGDELRYSKACSDNRCSDCEWDVNDCDCAHHEEREHQ